MIRCKNNHIPTVDNPDAFINCLICYPYIADEAYWTIHGKHLSGPSSFERRPLLADDKD